MQSTPLQRELAVLPKMLHLGLGIILVLSTSVQARTQTENLLQNSSFEQGPVIPSGQDFIPISGPDLPSWNLANTGVEYNGEALEPSDGLHSVTLRQGLDPGWIEQTIPTIPGRRYEILLDGKLLNGAPVSCLYVDVTVDGQPVISPRIPPPFSEFKPDLSSTFVAYAANTTIRFTNRIPEFLADATIHLDRVRVSESIIDAGTAIGGQPAGDLNGDGFIDLIAGSAILLGDGNRGFIFRTDVGASASPIGDIDGDGNPDLYSSGSVLLGDGNGEFTAGAQVGPIDSPVFGDINSDGRGDLVGVKDFHHVIVRVGNGGGGFGPEIPFDVGFEPPVTVALCDINNDEDMDIVVGFIFRGPKVLLGDGTGFFVELPMPPSFESICVATGDVNGDGYPDIVTAAGEADSPIFEENRVPVFLGDGQGGFTVTDYQINTFWIDSVSIGDIDGDGYPDIVAEDWLLVGDGAGGFLPARRLPTAGELVDLDSDGQLDLVAENMIYFSQLQPPDGTTLFGSGTPGCAGNMGIVANSVPQVGNRDFELSLTNLPRQSMGTLLVGVDDDRFDPLLGMGLRIHMGIDRMRFTPVMFSNCNGAARVRLPIPGSEHLAGSRFYLQGLWTSNPSEGDNCSRAVMGLQTTRALKIEVQQR